MQRRAGCGAEPWLADSAHDTGGAVDVVVGVAACDGLVAAHVVNC